MSSSVNIEVRTFSVATKFASFYVDSKTGLKNALQQRISFLEAKNRLQKLSNEHCLDLHRSVIFLANATFLVLKRRPFHGDSKNSHEFEVRLYTRTLHKQIR